MVVDDFTEFKSQIIELAVDKKAIDIRGYDVKNYLWLTDYILVMGVSNVVHCKALTTEIIKWFGTFLDSDLGHLGIQGINQSGDNKSGWVILDMGSIIIHCINDESRQFYKLDDFFEQQGVVYHF